MLIFVLLQDLITELLGFLIKIFSNIRRDLFFPWSVLDYSIRGKPRFKSNLFFSKTIYYTLFYIKHIILTILLWPFLLRRIKCSKDYQFHLITILFYFFCVIWCVVIIATFIIMLLTKWFQIFVFLPLMRIIFFLLFEVHYRKNKKLLFKQCTKQELLDFNGDNMHKPEKSLLTYKESYKYGSTYKKFTLPVFCSSLAIDLNYELFEIQKINTYEIAKEKLIEILSEEFFDLLYKANPYLENLPDDFYYFEDEISIISTLIKRLDYNCIFLYFVPHLFGSIIKEKSKHPWLEEPVHKLMRSYLEKGLYKINPIFENEKILQIYQKYVIEKNDQVQDEFVKEIFFYELFFSNLKKKYYFHSSDGKIDFTHPFLPIFFFRFSYLEKNKKDWLEGFPELKGSIISEYNVLYPWLVYCY